ncbi:DUF664 domain-containing protein [Flexivirga caeni]|uniref:DUF664 domain-containing protein n=1 Tax=Flexivirga caeni TaxID=2294115 RepID=A0A3M9M6S1_9MICO|nr:DUF664 domain-containing protein [Flexivirga caeni]RNI21274.1 DUF664 domain-containing protein [Flexivirga caeni]
MSRHVALVVVTTYIDRALDGMTATLRELGDDLANAETGLAGGNTAYQIVRHCCGVLEFWGGSVLANRPIVRDREAEFTSSGTVAELVALVERQRAQFRSDLDGFDGAAPPRGPLREDNLDPGEVPTQGGILMHVYEELSQHRGHLDITADIVRAR